MHTLFGGIHPKTPWRNDCIHETAPWIDFHPPRIYLSMCENDETPCRPVVATGERVKVHQRIGEATGKKSVHIHSGVSGTVSDIREEINALTGAREAVVVIENDGLGEPVAVKGASPGRLPDRKALGGIVRESGIVGMGGASFPSHLKVGGDSAPDILLINGAECEPLLCADAILMVERGKAVMEGCRIVMAALGIPAARVGIEADKPHSLASMRRHAEDDKAVLVESLPHSYPMGGEKQLILRLTGREVPSGKLPSSVGVVVFNVATLAAVSDAVLRGIPLTHRLCSVVGDVVNAQTIRFPIGTRARDLVDFCGGWQGEPSRLVFGGPMMGRTASTMDAPLTKATNGLLLLNREHDVVERERPCIRCNRCSKVCPMRLMPQFIDSAGRGEDWRACARLYAESCINCGCCTYVCPSFIPLAANITAAAKKLKSLRKDA